MAEPVVRKFVPVGKGAELEVFIHGKGEPWICCTHAYGTFTKSGGWFVDSLASEGTIILVNPRSSGNSTVGQSRAELTMRQLVDDIEVVRKHFRGDLPWVFAGTSTGGMIGLLYVLTYGNASGLVINGSAPSWRFIEDASCVYNPAHPDYERIEMARQRMLSRDATEDAEREWGEVVLGSSLYRSDLVDEFCANASGGISPTRLKAIREELRPPHAFDVSERLGTIAVPTLITCGRHDNQCPVSQSQLMHSSIPRSDLAIFEESGHFPFFEEADAYSRVLHAFLSKLAPGLRSGDRNS